MNSQPMCSSLLTPTHLPAPRLRAPGRGGNAVRAAAAAAASGASQSPAAARRWHARAAASRAPSSRATRPSAASSSPRDGSNPTPPALKPSTIYPAAARARPR